MKLGKILGFNVKLKNDGIKCSTIVTFKWEEQVLKCDKREVSKSEIKSHCNISVLHFFNAVKVAS